MLGMSGMGEKKRMACKLGQSLKVSMKPDNMFNGRGDLPKKLTDVRLVQPRKVPCKSVTLPGMLTLVRLVQRSKA